MLGNKVTTIYLVFFYVIPFACALIFGWHLNFSGYSEVVMPSVVFLIYISFTLFFLKVFQKTKSFKEYRLISIKSRYMFNRTWPWLIISILYLVVGCFFYIQYGLSYRQAGPNISESGLAVWLIIVIKPIAFSYVVYACLKDEGLDKLERITLFIISIASYFALVGAIEAVVIIVSLCCAIAPRFYKRISNADNKNVLNGIFRAVAAFLAFVLLVYVGLANKIGLEQAYDRLSSFEEIKKVLYYLYFRASVHAISLSYTASDLLMSLHKQIDVLNIYKDAVAYRGSLLLGMPHERPEITSLNVLNYLNTYANPQVGKEIGSSPGVIASFLYVPFFPINLILGSFYLASFTHILNLSQKHKVNTFSPQAALGFFLVMIFLYSPFDSIILPGPALIYFMFMFLAISALHGNKYNVNAR